MAYLTDVFGRFVFDQIDDEQQRNIVLAVIVIYLAFAATLAAMVKAAWALSLLLGVALATDAVEDAKNAAIIWQPREVDIDDARRGNWYELVQRPVRELVHTTLPSLSTWGTTIFAYLVASWAFALLSVPLAAEEYTDSSNAWVPRVYMPMVVVVLMALPFPLLYAPAHVSSAAIELLEQINELRVRSENADKDALLRMERASRLHQYLISLNNLRGPGFIIGNVVIDKVFLKQLLTTVVAFGSSAVVFLVHVGTDQRDEVVCGLSDEGKAAFQTAARLINETCTFNITVGPGGVFERGD